MQQSGFNRLLLSQTLAKVRPDVQLPLPALSHSTNLQLCRGFITTASLDQNRTKWKQREKYTIKPIGMKKTGGRDHTGEDHGENLAATISQIDLIKFEMCFLQCHKVISLSLSHR